MDLTQLRRFLAAAEAGNFRRAAAALHVSQPALTQSIKNLETTLGVELFERGARGVTLTRFGEVLVPRAKMMLNERERIAIDLESVRSRDAMQVTVGVAPYFTRQLFPTAVLRLQHHLPTVKVQVIEAHTTELVKALQEGAIEFAFCAHNNVAGADPLLAFDETYVERYSVVARSGHPLFRKRRIADSDLAGFDWIVYDLRVTAQFLVNEFARRGFPPPRTPIITLSLPLMVSLIGKSNLLALMPEDFVRPEVAASRLRRVTGHSLTVEARSGILSRHGAVHGYVTQELMQNIRVVCAESKRAGTRARHRESTSDDASLRDR